MTEQQAFARMRELAPAAGSIDVVPLPHGWFERHQPARVILHGEVPELQAARVHTWLSLMFHWRRWDVVVRPERHAREQAA